MNICFFYWRVHPGNLTVRPLKIGLLAKRTFHLLTIHFSGAMLNFGGVRPCCFVFAWRLRCVLDDLNNAPGEALSSLLGALTRQERIEQR